MASLMPMPTSMTAIALACQRKATMASLAAARMEAVAEAEAVIEPKLEPKLQATSTVVD